MPCLKDKRKQQNKTKQKSGPVWKYFGFFYKRVGKPNLSTALSNSIVWECFSWYGIILEILLKYSGNRTSILWRRFSFSSVTGLQLLGRCIVA